MLKVLPSENGYMTEILISPFSSDNSIFPSSTYRQQVMHNDSDAMSPRARRPRERWRDPRRAAPRGGPRRSPDATDPTMRKPRFRAESVAVLGGARRVLSEPGATSGRQDLNLRPPGPPSRKVLVVWKRIQPTRAASS